jgi:hypothetical protein
MYRAIALGFGWLAIAMAQAAAQVSPFPQVSPGSGVLVQQGTAGSAIRGTDLGPLRNQERARYSVQQQSCASMSGASADRCYSELRTTIEADKLKNQAIESGARRDSK